MPAPRESKRAPAELIESDVDLLEAAAKAPASGEARAFPRYAFRGRAKAVVFPAGNSEVKEPQEFDVITTDLSRGGLSLLHRMQLFPGQQLLLVLRGANRLIEVCWCCRVWPGLYSAGCRFVGEDSAPAEEA